MYGPGEAWSGRRESNPRRLAWKASALPLSYARMSFIIVTPDRAHVNNPHPEMTCFAPILSVRVVSPCSLQKSFAED